MQNRLSISKCHRLNRRINFLPEFVKIFEQSSLKSQMIDKKEEVEGRSRAEVLNVMR
jgi:hypothetical protein